MKIGMIASPIERIPPRMYGGTERVIYSLTEELVKMGHDVTIFASRDSQTSAKLISVFDKPLREAYPNPSDVEKRIQITLLHLGNAYAHAGEFDIIHDHTSYFGLSYAQASTTPVISTIHGSLTSDQILLFKKFNKPSLVTISNSQMKIAPDLNYVGTIYNGLDMINYPYSKTHDGYLLVVGRFAPEKGIHNAITIARKLNLPLIIAAKLEDKYRDYFNSMIKPYLNNQIKYVGEVNERDRNILMSNAMCFLHPLEWEEPFGLTIIEAMSCGTPVVTFNRGAMSEIIVNGKNGFIVKDLNEAVECIKKIDTISREYCRFYSMNTFNSRKMARDYEAVYEYILRFNKFPQPKNFTYAKPMFEKINFSTNSSLELGN